MPFSGVTKSGRVWRKEPESDARNVSLNIVVSRGHSRWCPAYVTSEQALLEHHLSDTAAVLFLLPMAASQPSA